jgi:hypothetical protein
MQLAPPKYQVALRLKLEEAWLDPLEHDLSRSTEKEHPNGAGDSARWVYGSDCIPPENKSNVTVVTGGGNEPVLRERTADPSLRSG